MIKTDNKGNIVACITTKEDLDYTNFDLETIDYYDNFLIPSYEQEIERLHNIIKEVREKVKGVKKINNEVYKQTDMLERFYSRKWCNDEMDSFLEILDKENKND